MSGLNGADLIIVSGVGADWCCHLKRKEDYDGEEDQKISGIL